MKKIVYLLLVGLILVGCKQEITDKDISKINGYWEIEKVILKNGEDKNYKLNQTIDYFELKDEKGFRQKVMPQFDGKFQTNGIKENIKVIQKDNSFYMEYTTKFGKWKEEIVEIQDSIFTIKTNENVLYTYKKFKPFLFQ